MELKTYRASSMADALAEVKRDLGRDAVILHARTFKAGGVMGVGSRTIVEITASSDPRAPGPRPRAASAPAGAASSRTSVVGLAPGVASIPAVARAYAQTAPPAPAPIASPAARQQRRESATPEPPSFEPFVAKRLEDEVLCTKPDPDASPERRDSSTSQQIRPIREEPPAARASLGTRVQMAPVDGDARRSLESELASIKSLVSEVLEVTRRGGTRETEPVSGPFAQVAAALRQQGLSSQLIDLVIEGANQRLRPGSTAADRFVAARDELSRLTPIAPAPVPTRVHGVRRSPGPRVIALIGPTGVGKTTTIAKLAADYSLRQGLKVGLIAADTYRIAAVDQLKTYASIIDVPLVVAGAPEHIPSAMTELAPCDVVLLDTAGRSQRDSDRLDELERTLEAAAPERIHLVLAGTAAESVVLEAASRFGSMGAHSIIFTKLDEAVQSGMMLNVARAIGLGMSFFTTGQDVPDNIESATGDRVAGLILGDLAPEPA